MAHHIYHTRGIILSSQPSGESNRFYKIFTEELGLIGAAAQSVRDGKSKLRYVLQDRALIHVDLVRGKEVWRITSALEEEPLDITGGDAQKKLYVRACAFVERLLHGESRESNLFADLRAFATYLKKEQVPEQLFAAGEALSALRALATLGYIDMLGYEEFLKYGEYSQELLVRFDAILPKAQGMITAAIVASHL